MPTNAVEAPSEAPDAGVLWRILTSRHWLAAVSCADECSLFTALDAQPAAAEALAQRTDLDPRAVEAVLTMLAALGLLISRAGQFHLHGTARRHLLPDSAHYWGAVLKAEARNDPVHGSLVNRLRGNSGSRPEQRRQPFEHWDGGAVSADLAARIARFMHALALSEAPFVASHASLDGVGRLLDVGGGAGTLSIEIARARPAIRCTVMDLDGMCMQAAQYIRAADSGRQVDTCTCDMFRQQWPRDYDAVLMSNVLHDWSEEECVQLLARACEALPDRGRIYLHEALLNEDGAGPIVTAGLSLRMLLDTRGRQFTFASLRELLERAGFSAVEHHAVSPLYSLVAARKAL
jgi:hypothetical protein